MPVQGIRTLSSNATTKLMISAILRPRTQLKTRRFSRQKSYRPSDIMSSYRQPAGNASSDLILHDKSLIGLLARFFDRFALVNVTTRSQLIFEMMPFRGFGSGSARGGR
jgi:hypothetical protein